MKPFNTVKIGALLTAVLVVGIFGTYFTMNTISTDDLKSYTTSQVLGHVIVKVFDEDGNIKAYRQSDNAIVGNGMEILAGNLFSGVNATFASDEVDTFGIGTSGTAPADNDSTITFGTCANQTATFTTPGADVSGSNATITVNGQATFGPAGTCANTWREAGIFDDSNSKEMFARNTFTDVILQSTDSLQINWAFTFSDT